MPRRCCAPKADSRLDTPAQVFHLAIETTSDCRREGGSCGWFAGAVRAYGSAWVDDRQAVIARAICVGGLFWLFAGGLVYTLGAAFFLLERVRHFHFPRHLIVVAGIACHVVALVAYSG